MPLIAFLMLLLPIIFQLIFGVKALKETIRLTFTEINLISFFAQVLLSFLSLYLSFTVKAENNDEFYCGIPGFAPGLGMFLMNILLFIILFITMAIQHFVIRSGR